MPKLAFSEFDKRYAHKICIRNNDAKLIEIITISISLGRKTEYSHIAPQQKLKFSVGTTDNWHLALKLWPNWYHNAYPSYKSFDISLVAFKVFLHFGVIFNFCLLFISLEVLNFLWFQYPRYHAPVRPPSPVNFLDDSNFSQSGTDVPLNRQPIHLTGWRCRYYRPK